MSKLPFHNLTIPAAFAFVIVSFTSYPIPVQSTLVESPLLVVQGNNSINFVPRNRGRRTQRTGTGRRGPEDELCPVLNNEPPLTNLVPLAKEGEPDENLNKEEEATMAGTFESHPTFFVYVPYKSPNNNLKAKFKLLDENREEIIPPIFYDLSGTPGIVSIRPSDTKPLEEGKKYIWSFEILCDSQYSSGNPLVTGWIERDRLSPEDKKYLEKATIQQKLDFYFSKSIWPESLTLLVDYRRQKPEDTTFKAYWDSLLPNEDVKLLQIADKNIVQCCSFSSHK